MWRGILLGAGGLLALQGGLLAAALSAGTLPVTVAVATPAGGGSARPGWGPLVERMAAPVIDGAVQQLVRGLPVSVDGVRLHLPLPAQIQVGRRLDARIAREVGRQIAQSARRPPLDAQLMRALNAWLAQCTLRLGLGWQQHVWIPVRVQVVTWGR